MYKPSSYEDMKKLLVRDGAQVVITGDSLSYNRYDFDPEPRTNAYDCLPGIGSWSFLLRDAIHRQDPWFQHGDELKLFCQDARTTILASQMPPYVFPYQNRNISAVVENAEEEVSFSLDTVNGGRPAVTRAVLHFGRVPQDHAAQFDIYVDGQYQATVDQETQLLFLSPPYASDDGSGDKYARYHRILQEVTQQQQCLFFDLIDFFAEVPIADWRYDNVHFTQYGNRLLADALIKRLLPAGILDET